MSGHRDGTPSRCCARRHQHRTGSRTERRVSDADQQSRISNARDRPTNDADTQIRSSKPQAEAEPRDAEACRRLFAFTIDADKGRIVTIEKVEDEGNRKALTTEERTKLAKAYDGVPLQRVVEQAFEAGIACVLGEHVASDKSESSEDRELSSILLQTLIEASAAKDLVKGETLNRMIVGTLFRNAAKSPEPVSQ